MDKITRDTIVGTIAMIFFGLWCLPGCAINNGYGKCTFYESIQKESAGCWDRHVTKDGRLFYCGRRDLHRGRHHSHKNGSCYIWRVK